MTGETYSPPMVALRGLTILPEEVRHFDVSREKSLQAIEEAVKNGQKLFVSAQKDLEIEEPRLCISGESTTPSLSSST